MFQLNLDLFRLSAGNNLNADSYYRSVLQMSFAATAATAPTTVGNVC